MAPSFPTATNIVGGSAAQIPFQSGAGTTVFSNNLTYDSTNSVGQLLQVGASSTVAWSNTLDGGTF